MRVENQVTFQSDQFPDLVYCAAAQTFDEIMEWIVWVDRNRVPRRGRGWLTGSDSTVTSWRTSFWGIFATAPVVNHSPVSVSLSVALHPLLPGLPLSLLLAISNFCAYSLTVPLMLSCLCALLTCAATVLLDKFFLQFSCLLSNSPAKLLLHLCLLALFSLVLSSSSSSLLFALMIF